MYAAATHQRQPQHSPADYLFVLRVVRVRQHLGGLVRRGAGHDEAHADARGLARHLQPDGLGGCGWVWLDVVGRGWLWAVVVGRGRLWLLELK